MKFIQKEVQHLAGKAIHNRQMIRDGDHVMVAVSGGKDSLTLLWLLMERLRRVPISFRLTAVHVDPGFGAQSARRMAAFFESLGVPHRVLTGDMGPLAHSAENRENPCFLCARLRRRALFRLADELGCNRIAFGHHQDDIIETFFLNVFYGASISTMLPVQELFQGRLTLIRPLYMVDEGKIERFFKLLEWQEISLGCPTAGGSRRADVKDMLRSFYRTNRKIKGNIFHALHHVKPEYLP